MIRNFTNKSIHHLFASFLFVSGLVLCVPAMAQDTNARLGRIEKEIETLSRAIFRGETPPPGSLAGGGGDNSLANAELRLQQIEMELRTLTGAIEQQNFTNQQFQNVMEKTMADMEMRVAELEMQLGGAGYKAPRQGSAYQGLPSGNVQGIVRPQTAVPAGAGAGNVAGFDTRLNETQAGPPVQAAAQGAQGAPGAPGMGQLGTLRQPAGTEIPDGAAGIDYVPAGSSNPAESYEQAFSLLRARNYDAAGTAFQDFLERYPGHDLAANAKYWLGETYYVRNDFERAARVFAEAYQQYPKGPKGPDSLLKLGMSLTGMGKTDDACLTYAQLKKEYPNGAVPILMRAEKEMETLECRQF